MGVTGLRSSGRSTMSSIHWPEDILDRMVRAVEKVRERLHRAPQPPLKGRRFPTSSSAATRLLPGWRR